MTGTIGFDKQKVVLDDIKALLTSVYGKFDDLNSYLSHDCSDLVSFDNRLTGDFSYNSDAVIHYSSSFSGDSLSMSVGEVKSILLDVYRPLTLTPSPSADDAYMIGFGFTDGSYVFSYSLDDGELVGGAVVGRDGRMLYLYGKFPVGGVAISKSYKVVVRRIA